MGVHKTTLSIGRQSMLERVIGRLKPQVRWLALSVGDQPVRSAGLPCLPDTGLSRGPLLGILSGLRWASRNTDADWLVSVPADAPFLPADLVEQLLSGRAPSSEVVAARSLGRFHPIIALWPVALAGDLEAWLSDPRQRAAKSWLATRAWSAVDFPVEGSIDPFFNVNTPEDLAVARAHAEQAEGPAQPA